MPTFRGRLRAFVVEAYLPAADQPAAIAIGARLSGAAADLQTAGMPIAFESGQLLPDDEVAFYVFSAESREAVEIALTRAGVRFDRIAESVPLTHRG